MNGYSATFGRAFEIRVRSDDFPAFGSPTSAASASSLSRRSNEAVSPESPVSAKRGVRSVGDAKRLFPRPPLKCFGLFGWRKDFALIVLSVWVDGQFGRIVRVVCSTFARILCNAHVLPGCETGVRRQR